MQWDLVEAAHSIKHREVLTFLFSLRLFPLVFSRLLFNLIEEGGDWDRFIVLAILRFPW